MANKFDDKYKETNIEIENNKKILNKYINIRIVFIILDIIFIVYVAKSDYVFLFLTLFIIDLFVIIFFSTIVSKYNKINNKLNFKLNVIRNYKNRIDNKFENVDSGLDYASKEYFETDLDIFGDKSIYSYISFAKTGYGKFYLAESLNGSIPEKDELLLKQEAISELSLKLDNILDIESASFEYEQNTGEQKFEEVKASIKALDNVYQYNIFKVIFSCVYFIAFLAILILSIMSTLEYYYLVAMIFIGFFLGMVLFPEASNLSNDLSNVRTVIKGYDNLIEEISNVKFENKLLSKTQEPILKMKSKSIKRFNIISSLSESRKNILFQLISNGIFMIDPIIVLAYYKWQKNNKDKFKLALDSIGKLEALISLTTISFVKETVCMPKVSNDFKFKAIKHPLIKDKDCISNDFIFKDRNIITGSNMSGKTTFMRSIGTNYILFLAGSMVNALEFEAPILKIFTSMKVVDDVNNNISTFYGEILRVKKICQYVKENKPMLVLIDEIFKGTNTKDRIVGAVSAINKLDRNNIFSIVTTHDPELCEIPGIKNYHFLEHYENDKIKFDYKIHDGISTTRNAIYLLKMAGIID